MEYEYKAFPSCIVKQAKPAETVKYAAFLSLSATDIFAGDTVQVELTSALSEMDDVGTPTLLVNGAAYPTELADGSYKAAVLFTQEGAAVIEVSHPFLYPVQAVITVNAKP